MNFKEFHIFLFTQKFNQAICFDSIKLNESLERPSGIIFNLRIEKAIHYR